MLWKKIFILGTGLVFLIAACAKAPKKEIEEAKAAIEAAVAAGAETYAPEKLKDAKDALAEAESNVEKKNYESARVLAKGAKQKANKARAAAESRKAEAKEDAKELLGELGASVNSVKALIDSAAASKVPEAKLTQLKSSCDSLETSVDDIQKCVDSEDYSGAIKRGDVAKKEAKELQRAIRTAIEKTEALRR